MPLIEEDIATQSPTKLRRSNRQVPEIPNETPVNVQPEEEYGFLDYKNIERIRLGRYEFDTWFGNAAIFTEPIFNKVTNNLETNIVYQDTVAVKNLKDDNKNGLKNVSVYTVDSESKRPWLNTMYFCPFCFKYTDNEDDWEIHQNSCVHRTSPPGRIMYKSGDLEIHRVSGFRNKLFCQCLCLLAKFFLDNKSIFYFVDNFDFYVVYKHLDGQMLPMGFYSRELLSWEQNNLSCICVFPCYQKHNLGTILIEFSYTLSKYEKQISGPEHPLSPLGEITYLKYWCKEVFNYLTIDSNASEYTSLKIMSENTGIRINELLTCLSFMGIIYKSGKKDKNQDYYHEQEELNVKPLLESQKSFNVYINKLQMNEWMDLNIPIKHRGKLLEPSGFLFEF